MKISVVIPVYNVEKYLRECIDSVLCQSLGDFELIAVDDGSPDASGAILDEYAGKDSRVTVIHKQNEGVSIARNTGLEKCTGDYVYIMDSDDYLEKDALENMYNAAVRTGADVVVSDHCKFMKAEEQKPCHFFEKELVTEDPEVIQKLQLMVIHKGYSPYPTEESLGLGIGAPWTKLLKRELITGNNLAFDPYVKGVFDDCLFSLYVFEHARKVAYIRDITYHFRVLESSLTHRYRPNQLEIYSRIYEKIRAFGEEYHKGETFRKAYYARVILYLGASFGTYFFHKDYQGGILKNYREFRDTIRSETYSEAVKNVEISKLTRNQKRNVALSRMHLIWVLWAAQYTKRRILKK